MDPTPTHDTTSEQVSESMQGEQQVQAAQESSPEKAPVEAKGEAESSAPAKKAVPEEVKSTKKNGWMQDRISHYARKTRETEERLAVLQRELEQMRASGTGKTADPNRQPSPDDYSRHEDYVDALVEWRVSQRMGQHEQQQAQRMQQQTAQFTQMQRQMQWNQHVQKFASLYDDPQAVIGAMQSEEVPVTDLMGEAIMDLGEQGPEVLFYLSQNPMEAMRLANLSMSAPRQAVMQIGRLADQLQKHTSGPAAQAPQAPQPKPVPSVRGGASFDLSGGGPTDKDSPAQWYEKEAARVRAKFGERARVYVPRSVA